MCTLSSRSTPTHIIDCLICVEIWNPDWFISHVNIHVLRMGRYTVVIVPFTVQYTLHIYVLMLHKSGAIKIEITWCTNQESALCYWDLYWPHQSVPIETYLKDAISVLLYIDLMHTYIMWFKALADDAISLVRTSWDGLNYRSTVLTKM